MTQIIYKHDIPTFQRKRKVCMGETMKTGSRQAVIGIRISEPRFQSVNGTSMEHVQQVNFGVGQCSNTLPVSLDYWPDWRNSKAKYEEVSQ